MEGTGLARDRFKVGDRVRLSADGQKWFKRGSFLVGRGPITATVVGFGRRNDIVRAKPDGEGPCNRSRRGCWSM